MLILQRKVGLGTATPWDMSGFSYDGVFKDISTEDGTSTGIAVSSDGTKMYMSGAANDSLYQYTMTTPWDLGSASYDSVSLPVGSQDGTPQGITFKPDGLKMYMPGGANDFIYQYTLSSAWDLSTASYASISKDVNPPQTSIYGVDFKPDGTKMYVAGSTPGNPFVAQYTLSNPWVVSSASNDFVYRTTTTEDSSPVGIRFDDVGSKMFISGTANNKVFQYTLSTPWDLSTALYSTISADVSENANVYDLVFRPNGLRMYTIDITGDMMYQYSAS